MEKENKQEVLIHRSGPLERISTVSVIKVRERDIRSRSRSRLRIASITDNSLYFVTYGEDSDEEVLYCYAYSDYSSDVDICIKSSKVISFMNVKIKKVVCNDSVGHLLTSQGQLYSWGLEKSGLLGMGMGMGYNSINNNFNNSFNNSFNNKFNNNFKNNFNSNVNYVHTPILNHNLKTKRITDISMSNTHCCCIDTYKDIYMWGSNLTPYTNIEKQISSVTPVLIDLNNYLKSTGNINKNKNNCISKICCGEKYTAFLNYTGEVFYFGKIDKIDKNENNQNNENFEKFEKNDSIYTYTLAYVNNTSPNNNNDFNITFIPNRLFTDIFAGKNLICLKDNKSNLFYYREKERLKQFDFGGMINFSNNNNNNYKYLKLINDNVYLFDLKSNTLLEILFTSNNNNIKKFSDPDYKIFIHHINEELKDKFTVNVSESPYYTKIIPFKFDPDDNSDNSNYANANLYLENPIFSLYYEYEFNNNEREREHIFNTRRRRISDEINNSPNKLNNLRTLNKHNYSNNSNNSNNSNALNHSNFNVFPSNNYNYTNLICNTVTSTKHTKAISPSHYKIQTIYSVINQMNNTNTNKSLTLNPQHQRNKSCSPTRNLNRLKNIENVLNKSLVGIISNKLNKTSCTKEKCRPKETNTITTDKDSDNRENESIFNNCNIIDLLQIQIQNSPSKNVTNSNNVLLIKEKEKEKEEEENKQTFYYESTFRNLNTPVQVVSDMEINIDDCGNNDNNNNNDIELNKNNNSNINTNYKDIPIPTTTKLQLEKVKAFEISLSEVSKDNTDIESKRQIINNNSFSINSALSNKSLSYSLVFNSLNEIEAASSDKKAKIESTPKDNQETAENLYTEIQIPTKEITYTNTPQTPQVPNSGTPYIKKKVRSLSKSFSKTVKSIQNSNENFKNCSPIENETRLGNNKENSNSDLQNISKNEYFYLNASIVSLPYKEKSEPVSNFNHLIESDFDSVRQFEPIELETNEKSFQTQKSEVVAKPETEFDSPTDNNNNKICNNLLGNTVARNKSNSFIKQAKNKNKIKTIINSNNKLNVCKNNNNAILMSNSKLNTITKLTNYKPVSIIQNSNSNNNNNYNNNNKNSTNNINTNLKMRTRTKSISTQLVTHSLNNEKMNFSPIKSNSNSSFTKKNVIDLFTRKARERSLGRSFFSNS